MQCDRLQGTGAKALRVREPAQTAKSSSKSLPEVAIRICICERATASGRFIFNLEM